jgi:hypothetical protein
MRHLARRSSNSSPSELPTSGKSLRTSRLPSPSARQASRFFEDGKGAVDLAGFLVAAEEVAHLAAGDAVGSVFGERSDLIGGRVAEAVCEVQRAESRACSARRGAPLRVGLRDLVAAVEDRGGAGDVRLDATGRGAGQALVAAPQLSGLFERYGPP